MTFLKKLFNREDAPAESGEDTPPATEGEGEKTDSPE